MIYAECRMQYSRFEESIVRSRIKISKYDRVCTRTRGIFYHIFFFFIFCCERWKKIMINTKPTVENS